MNFSELLMRKPTKFTRRVIAPRSDLFRGHHISHKNVVSARRFEQLACCKKKNSVSISVEFTVAVKWELSILLDRAAVRMLDIEPSSAACSTA